MKVGSAAIEKFLGGTGLELEEYDSRIGTLSLIKNGQQQLLVLAQLDKNNNPCLKVYIERR